jgi:hypothetical protein
MSAFLGGCPALMLRVASQWATPADLEIFSQIGICLLFASEYHCLHLCITLIPGEYRINCISLLIHSIYKCVINEIYALGKGSKKKVKKYGLLPNRGGEGSARVVKNQTAFLKKVFFREYLESF